MQFISNHQKQERHRAEIKTYLLVTEFHYLGVRIVIDQDTAFDGI